MKSTGKHEKDDKRARYSRKVANIDCDGGFRVKTIQSSRVRVVLIQKTTWSREDNVQGEETCCREKTSFDQTRSFSLLRL